MMSYSEEFWRSLTTGSLPALGMWSYPLLFLLVALEGPGATLLGGLLAAGGRLNPVAVFLTATLGNMVTDIGWYFVGRVGDLNKVLNRFGWLRRHRQDIDAAGQKLHDHSIKFLLISKLSFGVTMIPTLIAAGMVRVPWLNIIVAGLIGGTIWTGILVLFGYYFGRYITQFQSWLQGIGVIIGIGAIAFAIWWVRSKFSKKKQRRNMEPPSL